MKFVLAPDKFKGSLTGTAFCQVVAKAVRQVFPDAEVISKPLADGGDGTLSVVAAYLDAGTITVLVDDPLFRKINATYLYSPAKKTAFIEMSEASGHRLLSSAELNCNKTTSLGTGQLIADALARGAKEIVLGIGGSATNDGGMGMAQALGYRFLDAAGQELQPIGANLIKVAQIKDHLVDPKLKGVKIRVACDVANPFYGPDGAAYVYAPQKGATAKDVKDLDLGLQSFAKELEKLSGLKVQEHPGAGAAGGLGGGAMVFLNAVFVSGIDFVKEIAQFDQAIANADWIITGEGSLDTQTLAGKTISGVLAAAKKNDVKVAAFCGVVKLSLQAQKEMGLNYCTAILKDFQNLEAAQQSATENLHFAVYNFCNAIG